MKPLVFVTMPFGKERNPLRRYTSDFDETYTRSSQPAVARLDVECVRADEEFSGGIIYVALATAQACRLTDGVGKG
jgi:hypothetical protein